MPSERATRSATRKPIRGTSVSRYGSSSSTAITSVPYVRTSRAARPAPIPCEKRNVSTSRIGGDLTPRLDRPLHRTARDRAARLRPHLAQPLRITVELGEDVLRAEMLDDRTREGRANARNAAPQPERDALRRLRQGRAERLDGELPAVTRVPLDRAGDDDALARRQRGRDAPRSVTGRPFSSDADQIANSPVRRNPARPARRKRHRQLAHLRVNRRLILDRPHPRGYLDGRSAPVSSSAQPSPKLSRGRRPAIRLEHVARIECCCQWSQLVVRGFSVLCQQAARPRGSGCRTR